MNLYLINTDNINKSGSIGDTYPLNQDKIWQIHVPKGCKMTLYFTDFDLEVSERCSKDSFSVQTSKYQQDVYRYCHNLHEIEIRRKKRVQLTFHSDRAITREGIRATACLSNLHDPTTGAGLNQQLPCTCNPSTQRRKKQSLCKYA